MFWNCFQKMWSVSACTFSEWSIFAMPSITERFPSIAHSLISIFICYVCMLCQSTDWDNPCIALCKSWSRDLHNILKWERLNSPCIAATKCAKYGLKPVLSKWTSTRKSRSKSCQSKIVLTLLSALQYLCTGNSVRFSLEPLLTKYFISFAWLLLSTFQITLFM